MHGVRRGAAPEQDAARRAAERARIEQYGVQVAAMVERRRAGDLGVEQLEATARILEVNPDHYTVWNYRKEILVHQQQQLPSDQFRALCARELKVVEQAIRAHPKSYWVWHQRVWVLDRMPSPDWRVELGLCNLMLDLDKRNFHCWDFRRHVCAKIGRQDKDEFDYTLSKINQQFSNYSAWHLRSELLPRIFPAGAEMDAALATEFKLVTDATFTSPEDQSAWLYQRWLIGKNFQATRLLAVIFDERVSTVAVVFSNPVQLAATRDAYVFGRDPERPLDGHWHPSHASAKHPSHVHVRDEAMRSDVSSLTHTRTRQLFAPKMPLDGTLTVRIAPGELIVRHEAETPAHTLELASLPAAADGVAVELGGPSARPRDSAKLVHARPVNANERALRTALGTVEELITLEPEAKWPLLSSVLLMRDLVQPELDSRVHERLEKLAVVDADRAAYYSDLRSKFEWEDALAELFDGATGQLQLIASAKVHLRATALWSAHCLASARAIDLSGNRLRSLQGAHCWAMLEKLNLDGNELAALSDDLGQLRHLRTLHLRNNRLADVDDLHVLACCQSLRSLDIAGNPLCAASDHAARVWALMPQLDTLDGREE